MTRWAVVGGGLLGAAAARRLRADGNDVVVFEAAPSLGGLASAWNIRLDNGDTLTWDRFYHVILGTDRRVLQLVDDLQVGPVSWAKSKAACFADGRALPATSAAELLGLPFLGLSAKLRIAITVAWAGLWKSGERFDRLTAARWLRRWSGRQATERLWLPLLQAKLGHSAEAASATFIWATIRRLVTARLQGLASDRFGYVPGGYAAILDKLVARLGDEGVQVRTGCRITAVRPHDAGGLDVTVDGELGERFDRVLMTTPAPMTARLCPDLDAAELDRLSDVTYLGVLCPSVILRRPVTGAYITYITDPKPFTAVIEMTALVDPRELGGYTLVYLPRYTDPEDPAFDRTDEALRAEFLPPFLAMYRLSEDDVVGFSVARARLVLPVPTPGYRDRVPAVRTTVEGLYAVGSARILDGTLNVEQTLQLLDDAWPELDVHGAAPAPSAVQ